MIPPLMGMMTGMTINEEMKLMMEKYFAFECLKVSHFLPNYVSCAALIFFIRVADGL